MTCKMCGATITEGSKNCVNCGAAVESSMDTKPPVDLGATVIFAETKVMENMGATKIYQEKDFGKTVIFKPEEQRKPIYGWLVVTEGADQWKDFRIADEESQLFLGKGAECQLLLQDNKIEKIHASMRIKDGNLTITDFDTVAGTFVNNEAITRKELHDGDTIKIGDSTLRFRTC
jgi:hypothetical protein